jgi:hypothetical protein
MKKFLIALNIVVWSIVGLELAYGESAKPVAESAKQAKPAKSESTKKSATKKEVKKHQKFEGTAVPTAPAKTPAKKK